MVETGELRALIDGNHEWLLVRESGRSFSLDKTEIEVAEDGKRRMFGFTDDKGFHLWRLDRFKADGREIAVDVAGPFGRLRETLRLVPRTSAAELAAEIELARLTKANETGRMLVESFDDVKVHRVALNKENGRLANIIFTWDRSWIAAIADVTATMTPEAILTSAMLTHQKLSSRSKNPVSDIWLVAEKRVARQLQKLHTLLSDRWRAIITVAEVSRRSDPASISLLRKRRISDLWRDKAAKLDLPENIHGNGLAKRIVSLSPDNLDIIHSKHGETVRYLGLPVARVRRTSSGEQAWFGAGPRRMRLDGENLDLIERLVDDVTLHRSADPPNVRHEFYRAAPEAWLESLLRRNITLLDANLILAPIYNQFRSSRDKIDLLALRRDGRLVVIELKTQPDREMVFQAADYWRKIELQRRRGVLAEANLFDGREISDRPTLVYLVAPALSFHHDHEFFARAVSPEIEIWRFELHERWRDAVRVVGRVGPPDQFLPVRSLAL